MSELPDFLRMPEPLPGTEGHHQGGRDPVGLAAAVAVPILTGELQGIYVLCSSLVAHLAAVAASRGRNPGILPNIVPRTESGSSLTLFSCFLKNIMF